MPSPVLADFTPIAKALLQLHVLALLRPSPAATRPQEAREDRSRGFPLGR